MRVVDCREETDLDEAGALGRSVTRNPAGADVAVNDHAHEQPDNHDIPAAYVPTVRSVQGGMSDTADAVTSVQVV